MQKQPDQREHHRDWFRFLGRNLGTVSIDDMLEDERLPPRVPEYR
jgi:hypothetical protein